MDINYDLIIKHLCNKSSKSDGKKTQPEPNKFITQKNIFTYSNTFPESFKELLNDKFYRYGITVYDNEHNNISFWSSIMTILDKNFLIPYTSDELSMVNQFKTQLVNSYDKATLSDFIKKLDKNDIRERFKLNPDITVIQYICDILDINIWVWDFKSENIHVVYHNDIMNPWKQSIFLATHGVYWEPIMCLKSKGNVARLFDFNNVVFKKLLYSDKITYFDGDKIGKEYIFMDNITDVLKQERQKLGLDVSKLLIEENEDETDSSVHTDDDEESNSYFVKADELEEIKKLNKTKINKMKVAELIDLTKKLNIVITKKNPTKAVLMESILGKISNG